MNVYKKLIGNSIIFAVGNLGSKLISIILVPLYTYYLSASEYGMIDIVTTTTSMMLPVISLSIFESVLRFSMDDSSEKEQIFTNSLIVTVFGSGFSFLLYALLINLNLLDNLLLYMFIILVVQAFQALISQFVRAIGRVKVYSLNGILMTIITGVLNIIFLIYLNLGIDGYLLSIIMANIFSIIYMSLSINIFKYIKPDKIQMRIIKKMLVYSLPLIPNALIWWAINASNRYFILYFVGANENGLYAVANKIPSLLSMLNLIFFQAWQLSAIEEFSSSNKSNFYSNVFSYFSTVMFLGTSVILIFIKYIMSSLIAPEYYPSWEVVPFLLLGVVFSSFSGFLGTNYIAAKQTEGVFKTSLIGGTVNIISNLFLIPLIGIKGAGLATMFSFLVMWVLRIYDTKKFIDMHLDVGTISLNLGIILIQTIVLFLNQSLFVEFILESVLFIIVLAINRIALINIISKLIKK